MLISKSAERGIDALMRSLRRSGRSGYRTSSPVWEAESGDVFSEAVHVTEDAYGLLIEATS